MNHDGNVAPERDEMPGERKDLPGGYYLKKNDTFGDWSIFDFNHEDMKVGGGSIFETDEAANAFAAAMQPEPITFMADIALDLSEEDIEPGGILVKKNTAEADLSKAREVIAELVGASALFKLGVSVVVDDIQDYSGRLDKALQSARAYIGERK